MGLGIGPASFALALILSTACGPAPAVADPAPQPTLLPSATHGGATPAPPLATISPSPVQAFTPPASTPILPRSYTPTPVLLPSPTPIPEIEVLFTGDINPARCVYYYSKQAGDLALPYRPLAEILQGADITVGSLDGTLSDYNPPTPCEETHRNLLAPAEAVLGLQFAGFDVISVATNHIKDCGLVRGCVNDSMLDTLANLRAAGIQPVGAGRSLGEAAQPVIVAVDGVRFAFIGLSGVGRELWAGETVPGTAPLKPEIYLDLIRGARVEADVVVVLPHWGREYSPDINWEQSQAARAMVEAGAALVVGNHPHRVQGIETFPNSAVVAYALGNFVFDQTWSDGTQYTLQGVMLRATFRATRLQHVELIPIHIYDDFQPRLAPPEEAEIILQAVARSLESLPGR